MFDGERRGNLSCHVVCGAVRCGAADVRGSACLSAPADTIQTQFIFHLQLYLYYSLHAAEGVP